MRHLSHHPALAAVTLAAGAEDKRQAPARLRAKRFEHGFERVGRVRVIDNDTGAGRVAGDKLHPALSAGHIGKRPERIMDRRPLAWAITAAVSAFIAWKLPASAIGIR